MTGQRAFALIPARGGSKGIPRKNLAELGGVSLVDRALRCALSAERIERTLLSTDDPEIAERGAALGAEIVMRDAALADDDAPTLPVIADAMNTIDPEGTDFDAVVLLEPTSPFRTPEVVDACVEKLLRSDARTVLTVTALERNPRYIFSVEGDDADFYVKTPAPEFQQRQQFTHLKRLNGCVYAVRTANIRDGELVLPPIKVVEMPPELSINIDTPLDLKIAEMIERDYFARRENASSASTS